MKPTVEEQLQGTARILESVVAPAVTDSFARTILGNLIANLRMLTVATPSMAAFAMFEHNATLKLLVALRDAVPPEQAVQIDQAAGPSEMGHDEAPDVGSARLRAMLAEAVCSPHLTDDHHRLIKDYMVARASRVPMRYVPTFAAAGDINNDETVKNADRS